MIDAVKRSGKRAIFVSGFEALQSAYLPAEHSESGYGSLFVAAAPWPRLFIMPEQDPRPTASVPGNRAWRIPLRDQPLWGQRLYDLGVGPMPIPAAELSSDRLADGIVKLVDDSGFRYRAARLGALIRTEDGVGRAVGVIDQFVAAPEACAHGNPRYPLNQQIRNLCASHNNGYRIAG